MWVQFGRSEIIQNTLNPDFVRKFVMDYFFEESQKLKFEVSVLHAALGFGRMISVIEYMMNEWI